MVFVGWGASTAFRGGNLLIKQGYHHPPSGNRDTCGKTERFHQSL
jgi:hypothetical protein